MTRILKIFGSGSDQVQPGADVKLVEQYPAFTIVEASEAAASDLGGRMLVEDITDQYHIEHDGFQLDTSRPRIESSGAILSHPAYRGTEPLPAGPHHYIVQFIGPIKKEWRTALEKAGGKIVAAYGGFAVVARLTAPALARVRKLPEVRWLGHLPYSARLSHRIREQEGAGDISPSPETPRTRYLDRSFTVQFFDGAQASRARAAVQALGFDIVESVPDSALLIVALHERKEKTVHERLDKLSRVHGVRKITPRALRRTSNDRAAVIMGTAVALGQGAAALQLSGLGEVIGVCDTGLDNGDPATIHPDFTGRVLVTKSYPITSAYSQYIRNPRGDDGVADLDSGHGTHTTGSVLGDGRSSSNLAGLAGPVRGLSYRAKLVFQAVEQEMKWKNPLDERRYGRFLLSGLPSDLTTLFSFAYGKGVRIHSNSWGGGDPGDYDEQCRQVDRFVWDNPDFCIVFAAGNDGRDGNRDGVIDLGSVTPPGTAKNCITVGASENNRPDQTLTYGAGWPDDYPVPPLNTGRLADNSNDIAAFSSRGPTKDGRLKPDVVAPGTYILSTRSRKLASNNFGYGKYRSTTLYMFDSGTSMATPLTAGAVGVLREYLRKKRNVTNPSAALLKAALIAGAAATGAAAPPDNHQGFGRVNLDGVIAPAAPLQAVFLQDGRLGTGDLYERVIKVTTAGANLKVVLAYSDFPGQQLVNNLNLIVRDPAAAPHVGNSGGANTFDSTNNVEVVVIPKAAAGDYRLQVVGANVPNGPQPFAVVVIGAIAATTQAQVQEHTTAAKGPMSGARRSRRAK
jgi:hypothetical protein